MAHHDLVHQVQVRLSGRARESRVTPRVLPQRGVHQAGCYLRRHNAHERLIAQEVMMPARGSRETAPIQGVADQHIKVARILDAVAEREAIVLVDLVVEFEETSVGILCRQGAFLLRSNSKQGFRLVNQIEISEQARGLDGRFPAPLPFVIHKEEGLVLLDWTAKRAAELVLPERIRHPISRDGQDPLLQEVMRVESTVLHIIVKRTVLSTRITSCNRGSCPSLEMGCRIRSGKTSSAARLAVQSRRTRPSSL